MPLYEREAVVISLAYVQNSEIGSILDFKKKHELQL
jgi:hypothetical protein